MRSWHNDSVVQLLLDSPLALSHVAGWPDEVIDPLWLRGWTLGQIFCRKSNSPSTMRSVAWQNLGIRSSSIAS